MPAAQAAETLGLGEAIRQALASHPELTLNRIDSDIAATETLRIEGQLDPVVTASIGATDDKSPVASSFQPSRTVSGQLNAGISKPLANGDTVGASLAYNRARQSFSNPVAAQFALVNPAYRGQIDLNYRHPLLRGNDRPDYGDALQAAEDDVKASRLQRRTIARTLALQITNAYYQFASDHIQLRLAEQAVARAERLLNYQAFRERFGLIETSDRLQARALLEARRLDQAQAEAQLETDRTALNRLLLAAPDRPIEPAMPGNVTEQAPTDFEQLVDTASRKRPEFTILDTRQAAAEARLQQAMDTERSQLDLVAQLGSRSLDSRPGSAAGQAFGAANHYAQLSLEFSDALGNNSARAGIRKAELSRSRIVEERRQTMEVVRDDIARTWTSLKSGIPAYRQARLRVEAEKRKLDAELKRYREGRSDTATVVQFEGDLSNAERQAELLGVSLNLAEKQLAWAQGTLLDGLGIGPELAGAVQ
ncbi:MAG TPA: TolC family protein [Mariprofundaceae bacterium]|nr:TolC family protein [Mariprofundaceae bacterium]